MPIKRLEKPIDWLIHSIRIFGLAKIRCDFFVSNDLWAGLDGPYANDFRTDAGILEVGDDAWFGNIIRHRPDFPPGRFVRVER
jgi:hypothetical protein